MGWSATEAVGFAWNTVMKRFGDVALPIAVGVFVWFLPAIIVGFIRGMVIAALAASGTIDADGVQIVNLATTPIVQFISIVMQAFMAGGIVAFALKVVRGQQPQFGDVFGGARFFLPMLGAAILANIASVIGLILCVVPAVIVGLGLMFYPALIVDRQMGAVDALKESWRITNGHKMNLFIFSLLMFVVVLAGYLACCVGALLVSAPIGAISFAYIYVKLMGEQPVMAQ